MSTEWVKDSWEYLFPDVDLGNIEWGKGCCFIAYIMAYIAKQYNDNVDKIWDYSDIFTEQFHRDYPFNNDYSRGYNVIDLSEEEQGENFDPAKYQPEIMEKINAIEKLIREYINKYVKFHENDIYKNSISIELNTEIAYANFDSDKMFQYFVNALENDNNPKLFTGDEKQRVRYRRFLDDLAFPVLNIGRVIEVIYDSVYSIAGYKYASQMIVLMSKKLYCYMLDTIKNVIKDNPMCQGQVTSDFLKPYAVLDTYNKTIVSSFIQIILKNRNSISQ